MRDPDLVVVMPVYNEKDVVDGVVRQWMEAARRGSERTVVCLVDDGSSDSTPRVLDRLASELPGTVVLHQANRGHGQACVSGYRWALGEGARWILQVDSDGQCEAAHFGALWAARDAAPAVFGRRRRRQDGRLRAAISRVLALVVLATTGRWIPDANTPYRLMRADALGPVLSRVPADFYLANVLVSVLLDSRSPIRWVDVGFARRIRPAPFRLRYFVSQGWRLGRALRRHRRAGSA